MKVQAQPHGKWRVSLDRKESTGSVQVCLCLYRWGEPEQGRMGVLQNSECWWFSQSPSSLPSSCHLLKADYCSPELVTLMGSAMGSVFDEEPHANRILLVWPFPVSDHCSGGTGQKMSCSNLNLKWEAEYLEVLSPWSCSRTGGGWSWGWEFLIPVATVEQPLFPTLILMWAEWWAPSRKLRTGCQGQEGV